MKFFTDLKHKPLEVIIGLCVFTIVLGGGAIKNAGSASLAIMFLFSLGYIHHWREAWTMLSVREKWLCYGFMLFTLSGALSYINANDEAEFVRQMGRYIRFTLIIPVYLMLRYKRIELMQYFIAGMVASGFAGLWFALSSSQLHPGLPASGDYHHITFGDALMLNAGLMGVLLLVRRSAWYINGVIALSALCALYAAFLSQARGAWLALPAYLLLYMIFSVRKKALLIKLTMVLVALVMLLMLTPAGEIIVARYQQATTEIGQFVDGTRFDTSIGGRLAMWDIAYDVWREQPWTGTGLGDFDNDMQRYQAMDVYPLIDVHGSTHNIFVQALVSTGAIGLLALCAALVVLPLRRFIQFPQHANYIAQMGLVVIVSYVIFGLSESWILRAPVVSIFLACVTTLSSAVALHTPAGRDHAN